MLLSKAEGVPLVNDESQTSGENHVRPGLGQENGDDEPEEPLEHDGEHAGPYPKRFLVIRFVGLIDGHDRIMPRSASV